MKQILVILLSVSLVLSTTGVMVVTHYCGLKSRTGISFGMSDEPSCCCKKPMKKNCCHNEVHVLKIANEFNKSSQPKLPCNTDFIFASVFSVNTLFRNNPETKKTFLFSENPFYEKYRCILFQTLLI